MRSNPFGRDLSWVCEVFEGERRRNGRDKLGRCE